MLLYYSRPSNPYLSSILLQWFSHCSTGRKLLPFYLHFSVHSAHCCTNLILFSLLKLSEILSFSTYYCLLSLFLLPLLLSSSSTFLPFSLCSIYSFLPILSTFLSTPLSSSNLLSLLFQLSLFHSPPFALSGFSHSFFLPLHFLLPPLVYLFFPLTSV